MLIGEFEVWNEVTELHFFPFLLGIPLGIWLELHYFFLFGPDLLA
jgi:hypothetical protein